MVIQRKTSIIKMELMSFRNNVKYLLLKYRLYGLYNLVYHIYIWLQQLIVALRFKNQNVYQLHLNDSTIFYDTTDNYTKRWFYADAKSDTIYEPALSHFLQQNLDTDSCFLDVGAHIGYFSCIAAAKSTQGEVHLFEVDKHCIKYINKNIHINDFKNISVNNLAVSNSKDGVFIPNKNIPNNKTNIMVKRFSGRYTPSITIDDYVAEQQIKPDFIKIDVEGAEIKVIEGMQKTLQLTPLTLLIEVHNNILRIYGYSSKEILETLFKNGFTVYELLDFRNESYTKKQIDINHTLSGNTLIVAMK